MSDPSLIDEVWAEEGGIAVRIHHALNDRRKIEIVRYVKADKAEVIAEATIVFGRLSRLAKALWSESDERPPL